jgi:hypothetical protein
MLTPLESAKLKSAMSRFAGIQTSKDALDLAVYNEQTCIALGPFDPAFSRMKRQQLELENLALLLDKSVAQPAARH